MKKVSMNRVFVGMALIGSLLVTLCGCGGGGGGSSSGGSGSVVTLSGYTLTGKVAFPDGVSPGNARVIATRLEDSVSAKQARVLAARPAGKYGFLETLQTVKNTTGDTYATVTDAEGVYVLTNLKEGEYFVEAKKGGYKAQNRAMVSPTASNELNFYLTPTGNLTGTIRLAGATDYTGTFVLVKGTDYIGYTNSDGSFTIKEVAVGGYSIRFAHEGYVTQDYSSSVAISAGLTSSVGTIQLAVSNGGRITGTVTDSADAQPIGDVLVRVNDTAHFAVTDPDGNYVIEGVPAGTYTLRFNHDLIEDAMEKTGVAVSSTQAVTADQTMTDEKPPVWESTAGVVTAFDFENQAGHNVAVEFGQALDVSNPLTYIIYHAVAGQWDSDDWPNNNPVEVTEGSADLYEGVKADLGYLVSGLTAGERYIFGVRVKDRNGNIDFNTVEHLKVPDDGTLNEEDQTNLIAAMGGIGIGTTAPQSDLHITGSESEGIIVDAGDGHNSYIDFKEDGTLKGNIWWEGASDYLGINGMGTDTVFNQGGGNVGIGTTIPDSKLHVYTDSAGTVTPDHWCDDLVVENLSHVGIQLLSGADQTAHIQFGDAGSTLAGRLDYDHAADSMNFYTGATQRMSITSSGNVGIGTSSPAVKLDIASASTSSTDIRLQNTSTNGRSWAISSLGESHGFGAGKFNIFDETAGASRLTIDPDGSVGIGTISPAGTLHVQPSGGLPFVVDDATGYVGIGTTAPDAALTVGSATFKVNEAGTVTSGTWQGDAIADDYLAGISGSKVSPDFGAQNVVTTGSVTAASFVGDGSQLTGVAAAGIDDNTITSAKIQDGTIADADMAANAAIAFSKLNIVKADITGLGIPGADTNTQLSETEVDNYVSNNNYLTAVTSTDITDGTIADADVATDAAIVFSKLNIVKADITGLDIPGEDTNTQLSETEVDNYVSNNNYLTAVTSIDITDGTIADADVATDATIAFSKLNIAKADITGLGIPGEDTNTQLTETEVDNYVSNNNYLTAVTSTDITDGTIVDADVATNASIAFSKLNIAKADITGLGIPGEDTKLSETEVEGYIADEGYLTAVTSTDITDGTIADADVATNAAIAYSKLLIADDDIPYAKLTVGDGDIPFSKLTVVKGDITGLGIPGVDNDTTYTAGIGIAIDGTEISVSGISSNSLDAADGDPAGALTVDNTGLVGIGTTSPGDILHLKQSDDAKLIIETSTEGAGGFASIGFWSPVNGTPTQQGYINFEDSADYFTFGTLNKNLILEVGTGKVGIGSANPGDVLDVVGNIATTGNVKIGGNIIELSPGFVAGNIRYQSNQLGFYGGSSGIALKDSSGTNKVVMLNDGSVGIGTTSPGQKLDVKGTLRLRGSTSGYVDLAPAEEANNVTYTLPAGDGNSGQVLSTNGSGALSWVTNGTGGGNLWSENGSDVYRNSGGVGIGTSTPGTALDVVGVIRSSNGLTVIAGTVSLPANTITDAEVSNTLTASDLVAGSSVVADAEVDNDITLANITQITTRSHTSLSDIGTNSHAQIDTHIADSSNPHSVNIDHVKPTTTKGDLMVEDGIVVQRLPVGSNGQVLVADSSESFGIKWAVPTASDLVAGSSVVADAEVDDNITLTNITQITTRSHTSLSDIGTNSHTQIDTHIAGTSNPHSVNIDHVKPTTTKGDLMVEDGIVVQRLPVGSNGQVLVVDSSEATGVKWAANSAGDDFSLNAADGDPADALYVDNDGNVGIGTTEPMSHLHVKAGTTGYAGITLSGLSTGAGAIYFRDQSSSKGSIYCMTTKNIIIQPSSSGNCGVGDSATSPSAQLFVQQTDAADCFRVNDASSDTTPFVIYQDGKVGIGSASPGQTLDVVGNIGLSGNVVLPATASSSAGVIQLGSNRFAHNYGTQNTFVGEYAGNFTGTGTGNTALGNSALDAFTIGEFNTAVGFAALGSTTTGYWNTSVGKGSLYNNTEGHRNTALGLSTLYTNTTGYQNVAVGGIALYASTTGNKNTAVGYGAGNKTEDGAQNTFVGYDAGFNNVSGSGNVLIGHQAGWSETGSNKLYIHNAAADQDSSLIYGDFSSGLVAINGSVGIGTTSPGEKLDVNGTVNATKFEIDDNAYLQFQTIGGSTGDPILNFDAGDFLYYERENNYLQFAIGGVDLLRIDSSGNVGIGTVSPRATLDVHSDSDSGIVVDAGDGENAFYDLYENGTLKGNIWWDGPDDYMGINSQGTDTVLNTGGGNVGIGTTSPAVMLHVEGDNTNATDIRLKNTSTNGRSWAISSLGELSSLGAGSFNIHDETANAPRLTINSSGYVGIGTYGPEGHLHVYNGSAGIAPATYCDDIVIEDDDHIGIHFLSPNTTTAHIQFADAESNIAGRIDYIHPSDSMNFYTATVNRLTINSSGYVGIGTGSPGYLLHVNGTAGKPGGGSWTDSSDERLKTDIARIKGQEALDKITRLKGVTFRWKNPDEHSDGMRAGVIAQDLEKVFPDWVTMLEPQGEDKELVPEGEQVRAISFPHDFNAYLIEAIKELKAQKDTEIASLKTQHEEKDEEIDGLKTEVEFLRSELEDLRSIIYDIESR